ncbi:MAG: Gfo/Idh/MocA family oxidoreductase, partial [Planctomycetota bacterium]
PDHTHAVSAIASMKLGKHVYCEKPLTRTVREARAMRLVAEKQKVVTQMGNQGSESEGVRRAAEWAWAGTVGPIQEAYLWIGDGNSPMTRPTDTPDIPKELDWDLWLGPVSKIPYHPSYLPRTWRSWSHFGSGGLGDMGCHTGNFLFRGLRFETLWQAKKGGEKTIIRVDGKGKEVNADGYPRSTRVEFQLPARGDLPPVKLVVSSGKDVRPSKDLLHGENPGSFGSLMIGSKGSIYSSDPWNRSSRLLPRGKDKELESPKKTLPRGVGHYREFIEACKGRGETFSSFSMGGPLTELIQLANVAARVNGPFEFDPVACETNHAGANKLLHRDYRKGWSI